MYMIDIYICICMYIYIYIYIYVIIYLELDTPPPLKKSGLHQGGDGADGRPPSVQIGVLVCTAGGSETWLPGVFGLCPSSGGNRYCYPVSTWVSNGDRSE